MQRGSEQADADRGLAGHRLTPLRGSPFARNAPAIGIAYGIASIVWLSAGQALPGADAGWSPASSPLGPDHPAVVVLAEPRGALHRRRRTARTRRGDVGVDAPARCLDHLDGHGARRWRPSAARRRDAGHHGRRRDERPHPAAPAHPRPQRPLPTGGGRRFVNSGGRNLEPARPPGYELLSGYFRRCCQVPPHPQKTPLTRHHADRSLQTVPARSGRSRREWHPFGTQNLAARGFVFGLRWRLSGPAPQAAAGPRGGRSTQAPSSPLASTLHASRHRRSTVGGRTGLHGPPWDDPVVCLTGEIGDAFEVGVVMQHGESG
jgi:hypothetical protein